MSAHRTDALVAALRSAVVEGRIAPGEKLPSENELIAEHGVSRTVVREAITALRAEGLVRTRRGAGSYALTPPTQPGSGWPSRPVRTPAERRALLELRTGIESEAAGLAAARRADGDLAAMRHSLAAFRTAADAPATALEHDFAFHRAVAAAAANPYLLELVDALGPTMIAMPRHRLETSPDGVPSGEAGTDGASRAFGAVAEEHAAVLAAIEDGDPRAAAAAMRTHLTASSRRLLGDGPNGAAHGRG